MRFRAIILGLVMVLLLVGCKSTDIKGSYACTNLGENQAGATLEIKESKAILVFKEAGSAEFNLEKIDKYNYYLWLTNPSTQLKEGFNTTFSNDFSAIDFQKGTIEQDVHCVRKS
jgi:hypothetical protein